MHMTTSYRYHVEEYTPKIHPHLLHADSVTAEMSNKTIQLVHAILEDISNLLNITDVAISSYVKSVFVNCYTRDKSPFYICLWFWRPICYLAVGR